MSKEDKASLAALAGYALTYSAEITAFLLAINLRHPDDDRVLTTIALLSLIGLTASILRLIIGRLYRGASQ